MKTNAHNMFKCFATIALTSFCLAPAAAQSYNPSNDFGANGIRGGASIVIPFGGNKKNAHSKPRVEFSFQQSRVQQDQLKLDFNRYSLQNAPITNPNIGKIGFTLNQKPQMLVNGKTYHFDGDKKNVSTGEGILIGFGVLAGVILLSAVIITDDIEDGLESI